MRYLFSLILVALLSCPVMAAKNVPEATNEEPVGGFEGPVRGAQAETVEKAMKLAQDSRVVLAGNIIASIAGEKNQYIFKDATGEMTVLITPKQFRGLVINPDIKVQLSGKIEKTANAPDQARLRVSQLELIK